ncbi:MAG: glycosyltransferase [Sphingomonas sp.]|nr:glycosyltransferase [Sphingomonas sp.]
MRALYISYDGMTDPLGRSQVLPYLEGLAARGHAITLLSCEKPARMQADGAAVLAICDRAGIDWQPVAYHKSPPLLSGLLDVAVLKRRAVGLHRKKHFDLVHCRSYMAAIAGDRLKSRYGVPFLFDMRGFWADERVERGIWPAGNPLFRAAYAYFKRLETRFFRDADAIVSLTDSAKREVGAWPDERRPTAPITVIPCCVDLKLFAAKKARAASRKRLGIDANAPVMLYVGSIGGAYLMTEMLQLFRVYRDRRPGARFLFVSGHAREDIERLAAQHGVEASELIVVAARRDQVPALIAAADVGVSFILATYSAKASCPTKFGEMLAMGIPVIANSGVGDIAEILRKTRAGAVVDQYDEESLTTAIAQAEVAAEDPAAIRKAAVRYFALEGGVERYDAIYRAIGRSGV